MRFSFHRGSPALDFAGTVGSRASATPEERLPDPAALAAWLRAAGLAEAARPTPAELREAWALREAIYRLGVARVDGRRPDRGDLATLNAAAEGLRRGVPQLDARGRARWTTDAPVALALGRLAQDAIERLSVEPERLARCELPGCGALILSRSRSDRRRWCSMALCGNRAKVAAYRARKAEARATGPSPSTASGRSARGRYSRGP
jgi:predicted RNA-binding Zn ribbon-like protein